MQSTQENRTLDSREASTLIDEVLNSFELPVGLGADQNFNGAEIEASAASSSNTESYKTELECILRSIQDSGDWEVREKALRDLCRLVTLDRNLAADDVCLSSILDSVIQHTTDWHERVRACALEVLGHLPQSGTEDVALDALCNGIADHDLSVRKTAASSLLRAAPSCNDSAIERLLKLFADGRVEVRDLALVSGIDVQTLRKVDDYR